jgi:hypothetical protein
MLICLQRIPTKNKEKLSSEQSKDEKSSTLVQFRIKAAADDGERTIADKDFI